jgi:hypothetical protein
MAGKALPLRVAVDMATTQEVMLALFTSTVQSRQLNRRAAHIICLILPAQATSPPFWINNSLPKVRQPILLLIYFWSSWSCECYFRSLHFVSHSNPSIHPSIPFECPSFPKHPQSSLRSQIATGRFPHLLLATSYHSSAYSSSRIFCADMTLF